MRKFLDIIKGGSEGRETLTESKAPVQEARKTLKDYLNETQRVDEIFGMGNKVKKEAAEVLAWAQQNSKEEPCQGRGRCFVKASLDGAARNTDLGLRVTFHYDGAKNGFVFLELVQVRESRAAMYRYDCKKLGSEFQDNFSFDGNCLANVANWVGKMQPLALKVMKTGSRY